MAALLNHSIFDHYAGRGASIVIAVSGGGDSMALLDLYRLATLQSRQLPKPHIVTVDHRLRHGFAAEAATVEAYCAEHKLPWRLMSWEGDKPKTGIMAAARLARYGLLADAAEDVGAKILLTGHTLDDQNETVMMRNARGAASHMENDVLFQRRTLISRPLLGISRADLRACLATNKISFADDPTNQDMRFERARVRAESTGVISIPASPEARNVLVEQAAEFIALNVEREDKAITILRPRVRNRAAEILAIRYLAATLGQFEYPAPEHIGAQLSDLLDAGNNGLAFTAQRCRFVRIDGGISAKQDSRHQHRQWLNLKVSPFETFCAKSMIPLANTLAKLVGAKAFLMPL